MGTQSGSTLVNASITGGGSEVTSDTFLLDGKISIGVHGNIINGGTPPTSIPLILIIEYQTHSSGEWFGYNFQGSLTASAIIPIRNIKIPFDCYAWRYRYTPSGDQNVTLKLAQGGFLP